MTKKKTEFEKGLEIGKQLAEKEARIKELERSPKEPQSKLAKQFKDLIDEYGMQKVFMGIMLLIILVAVASKVIGMI